MPSKINVLQVIHKLGYVGAEIGCFDLEHYFFIKNSNHMKTDLNNKQIIIFFVDILKNAISGCRFIKFNPE